VGAVGAQVNIDSKTVIILQTQTPKTQLFLSHFLASCLTKYRNGLVEAGTAVGAVGAQVKTF